MFHICHRFWKCDETLTFRLLLTRCTTPCACHTKRALNVQKWVSYILISKYASRHNGVHFFDISSAKNDPHLIYFEDFDLEMLCTTTMCTLLPKAVRSWYILYILIWKSASRYNNVQFFIFSLAKWFRIRRL